MEKNKVLPTEKEQFEILQISHQKSWRSEGSNITCYFISFERKKCQSQNLHPFMKSPSHMKKNKNNLLLTDQSLTIP